MQVPAPFDYARAQLVDDAIALLEQHGEEARLVAGGHSLLPMMKLRLARPRCSSTSTTSTDLTASGSRATCCVIGAMVRHARSSCVRRRWRALPDAARGRAGHRRPRRTQPGNRRRVAVPGRSVRGPLGRSARALRAELRRPRVRRRADRAAARVPPGPYETVVGAGRDPHRGPHSDPAGRGQRVREGRATGGRLGGRVGGRRRLARRRDDHRRRHRPRRRGRPALRCRRDRGCDPRPAGRRRDVRRGRRARRRESASRRPTNAVRPTTSRHWPAS